MTMFDCAMTVNNQQRDVPCDVQNIEIVAQTSGQRLALQKDFSYRCIIQNIKP